MTKAVPKDVVEATLHAEIRSFVRNATSEQRSELTQRALAGKLDPTTRAALLSAPAYLANVGDDVLAAAARAEAEAQHSPSKLAAVDTLEKAIYTAERALAAAAEAIAAEASL